MWCCIKKPKTFHKSSKLYNVVNNFEETNVNECTLMDKLNEKIYTNLLQKANKAENNVKNSSIYMNIEVPPPPRPSNRDKYTLWKKRNISKCVIEQSEAVLCLSRNGFRYDRDYEAYQAIDLAIEFKKKHGIKENDIDKSKNFDHVFTKNDKNIMRRKSIQRVNLVYKDSDNYNNIKDNELLDMDTSDFYDDINNREFLEEDDNAINKITNITNITNVEPSAPPLGIYPCLDV